MTHEVPSHHKFGNVALTNIAETMGVRAAFQQQHRQSEACCKTVDIPGSMQVWQEEASMYDPAHLRQRLGYVWLSFTFDRRGCKR